MYDKLIKALQTIQNECKNNACETCPLGDKDAVCRVMHNAPLYWEIGEISEVIRVLK